MTRTHTLIAGLVAGVALAVAAATYAQPYGGMGQGFGPGMGMGHGHGPMAGVDPAAMADSHLSDLKAQLKINASQEAAWQAFATQAKAQAASMQAVHVQMQQDTGSAPERMARHAILRRSRYGDNEYRLQRALRGVHANKKSSPDPRLGNAGPAR